MAGLKTQRTDASVEEFLESIEDEARRKDCREVLRIMKRATGAKPAMWGTSIVGFGSYDYRYDSGREGKWFLTGFSPRKQSLTLYIMPGFAKYGGLMKKLGRHTTGVSCLYVKRLSDVDAGVIEELVSESVKYLREKYPTEP